MSLKKSTILNGNIFYALSKFTLPILLSLILQAFYGAVDLWMVSKFATTIDSSAVSLGSQAMLIVNGVITGLAIGVSVLLGKSIGQKNDSLSSKLTRNSLWLFLGISIFLTVLLICIASPIVVALDTPKEAYQATLNYILICSSGTIFVVAYNLISALFCGLGDSKTPLLFVGIACFINIAADYLLINFLELGATGAAIATIGAQAFSVIISVFVIKKRLPYKLNKEDKKLDWKLIFDISKLGIPAALLRMFNELSYLIILGFVNRLGVEASSGVGIAEKLVMFILLIPMAYMTSISTFAAQNIGANNKERAKKSMWIGMICSFVIGSIMAYLSFFHGDLLSKLFINDEVVIKNSATFLKATAIECLILSLVYCFNGYFNGLSKTTFVMLQGILVALFVRIPYAYFAINKAQLDLFDVGLSTAYAAIFMLLTCIVYYVVITIKNNKRIIE